MNTPGQVEQVVARLHKDGGTITRAEVVDLLDTTPGSAAQLLSRMVKSGDLERVEHGVYGLPSGGDGSSVPAKRYTAPSGETDTVEIVLHASRVSAHTGVATYLENEEEVFVLHKWIVTQILGIKNPPRRIGAAKVAGDCMEPDLMDGDIVFFDYDSGFKGPGRYVLWLHDGPNVKRLSTLSDGSFRIACDNKACGYVDEILMPNTDGTLIHHETGRSVELRIIGAVIWPRRTATQTLMAQIRAYLDTGHAEILRGSVD